jgi:hypothetical protein
MFSAFEALAIVLFMPVVQLYQFARPLDPLVLTWPRAHKRFVSAIQKPDKIILHQGVPRPIPDAAGNPLILKSAKIKRVLGFDFSDQPIPVEGVDADRLTAWMCDASLFNPIPGNPFMDKICGITKLCGGFHADFCIEFRAGNKTYRALVCYSCQEVHCYGLDRVLPYDIRPKALEQFKKIINDIQSMPK